MTRTPRRWLGTSLGVGLLLALVTGVVAAPPAQPRNFVTAMSGGAEVPIRDTHARGAAIFQLSADGTQISYKVIASNIQNVFMAHIHLQAAGTVPGAVNGPIVVWLAPSTAPGVTLPLGGGRHDGVPRPAASQLPTSAPTCRQPLSALLNGMPRVGRTSTSIPMTRCSNEHRARRLPGRQIRGQLP